MMNKLLYCIIMQAPGGGLDGAVWWKWRQPLETVLKLKDSPIEVLMLDIWVLRAGQPTRSSPLQSSKAASAVQSCKAGAKL